MAPRRRAFGISSAEKRNMVRQVGCRRRFRRSAGRAVVVYLAAAMTHRENALLAATGLCVLLAGCTVKKSATPTLKERIRNSESCTSGNRVDGSDRSYRMNSASITGLIAMQMNVHAGHPATCPSTSG